MALPERILKRIEELKQRLCELRSRELDSAILIGIEALELELARTADELPPEWNLAANSLPAESVNEGVLAGSRA